MQYIGIIKRVVPFFLTFAVGLLVASFFVPLTAPNFSGFKSRIESRRSKAERMRYGRQQVMRENSELREENYRLRERIAELESEGYKVRFSELRQYRWTPSLRCSQKERPQAAAPKTSKHEIHE